MLFAFGENLCQALSMPTPEILTKVQENKMMYCMVVWFVGGIVVNSMSTSGAFEIYINDTLSFSKLQTGQMPDQFTLMSILRANGVAVE